MSGSSHVLIVDDDADMSAFVASTLRSEGFEVSCVSDGEEALSWVAARRPDLVLLDVVMPGMDGFSVVRRWRDDLTTATLPVVMMTGQTLPADKVAALAAGADDHIVKPFDTLELVARVRSTLRRTADMRAASPLTGLPGNHRIQEEVAARTARGDAFAVCHVDLDNFKAFNDRYGWMRGDEVISLLAENLNAAASTAGSPRAFVGHVGGDDFAIVCSTAQAEPLCADVVRRFDAGVAALHDPDDVAAGSMRVVDRQGHERRYPLVSVSIGVATTDRRSFTDHRDVVAVASEMKTVAKRRAGSTVAIDRRTDPDHEPAAAS